MSRPIKIEASVACANLAMLQSDIDALGEAGIDFLHFDIMDGRFVDNFGLDFSIMKVLRQISAIPLDCHLMIEDPERYIDRTAALGAEYITIHIEATRHAQKALRQTRDAGSKPAIALNPATPVGALEYILDDIDMVTVMTVNPGAAGQALIPSTLKKIADVRHLLDRSGHGGVDIQADGNVSFAHIPAMVQAGANMLVGGTSSVFHRDRTIPQAITEVRAILKSIERTQ